jgi:RHS repeat-associated protein
VRRDARIPGMTAVGARYLFNASAGIVHALMQARYQNAGRGQFISEDPVFLGDPKQQVLTDPQTLNSYSYANGNPITKSDPSGLSSSFTDMGYFNSYYPGQPASVVQQIQQAKYDALKIGVGLPAATVMGGGALAAAAVMPEISALAGATYQGAIVDVALRATNDLQTGTFSTPRQYAGSAVFGAITGLFTVGTGLFATAGITALSSGAENKTLDGSVQPNQVAVNTGGAVAGQIASKAVSSVPGFKPFAPILGPAVNSVVTYGITAVSTTVFGTNKRSN